MNPNEDVDLLGEDSDPRPRQCVCGRANCAVRERYQQWEERQKQRANGKIQENLLWKLGYKKRWLAEPDRDEQID